MLNLQPWHRSDTATERCPHDHSTGLVLELETVTCYLLARECRVVTGPSRGRSGGTIQIMPFPLPVTVAWQGIRLHLPADHEIAGTYGFWRDGHLLVACERQPRLSVTWKRERLRPDLERTMASAVKRLMKENRGAQPLGDEAAGADGLLRRFSTTGGDRAVAARHFADAGVTVVWRQLAAAGAGEFGDGVRACEAFAKDAAVPWAIHGLDITLPAWWRCEGVQALPGLTRGVWMRYEDEQVKPDQVLVLRRLACAGRVLAGRSIAAWLRASLHPRETAEETLRPDDAAELRCSRPGATWWRRLRGLREDRRMIAWLDVEADRLTVQEWTGRGEPLPCLRHRAAAQGVRLPAGAQVA